ncbi:signal peptidase I [Furfurilactobacillus siliginis]|uniref:Signal peptidase I n=1 Tax=Furfurilactobacillus siliginis TaxID=348151 RepID=A0A0R2L3U9_9LACO|nr:signal peptidase I [Furfurilactobacillus siliginis]KRN96431.1 signal peptidase i [Furfurilactobacillus siliginis]GEK29187.1 signal peptidase I [Furfurilactobacillus siliginis]
MRIIKKVMSLLWPIIIGAGIAFLIQWLFVAHVRVDGPSMLPNLTNNEKVWAFKQAPIRHDRVIVFNAYGVDPEATDPQVKYVKRVIGMPGDTIDYGADGTLSINGKKVSQSYISKDQQTTGTLGRLPHSSNGYKGFTLKSLSYDENWTRNIGATKVPKDSYFVLGDNRAVSNDSRYYGFVPKKKVVGVVKAYPWAAKHEEINVK